MPCELLDPEEDKDALSAPEIPDPLEGWECVIGFTAPLLRGA
jgi:hypothetical protein